MESPRCVRLSRDGQNIQFGQVLLPGYKRLLRRRPVIVLHARNPCRIVIALAFARQVEMRLGYLKQRSPTR